MVNERCLAAIDASQVTDVMFFTQNKEEEDYCTTERSRSDDFFVNDPNKLSSERLSKEKLLR